MSERRSTWELVNLAGVGSPDRPDGIGVDPAPEEYPAPSPGARYLRRLEDEAVDLASEGVAADDFDRIHEAVDGTVPIYTHYAWEVFVDLAAYNEDVSEFGAPDGEDLTRSVAMTALYSIGVRLVAALLDDEELAA